MVLISDHIFYSMEASMVFRNTRTRFRHIAFLVTIAVFIFGVTAAGAQDGGTLRVGVNAPVVLDPALHTNDPETALNRAIYDYLVDTLPDSSIAPNLASDWTISEDGLTYTFTLVDGVTFHDGKEFSSADVVWTFNRLKEVGSPALNLLGEFEVSAPDASTVVFTIPSVNADFLYGVSARQALIIPDGQDAPNAIGEGDTAYASFNGTGPFVLQSLDPGSSAVLTRNDNYWKDGQPLLAGLEFTYIDDSVAQVDALLSGQLDLIYKISPEQIDRLEGNEGVNVIQQMTSQHGVIRLRTDEGSLGEDVRVRQALKYATDREQLNDVLWAGRATLGNNDPIAPAFGEYYDDAIENQTYDPDMACQLLTEAGMNPLEATLYAPNALGYPDVAALLQQQWAAACINVDIQIREEGYYYDVSNPDNYFDVQLGITGWGARPSPQLTLQEAYVEAGIATGYNESRFVDAELEDLIAQGRATSDVEARREIYAQISQIFLERGPIIVPFFPPLLGATSAGVTDLTLAPFPGLTDFRTVSISS
jgi:peptide/nickel transport system substrate-binding protein